MSDVLAAAPLARAIGLALVQFLWQGLVIGAGAALILIALRRASAQARYVVGCVGLAVMLLAPIVTAARALREMPAPAAVGAVVVTPATSVARAGAAAIGESDSSSTASFRAALEPWLPLVVAAWSVGVLLLTLQLLRGWVRLRRIHRQGTPLESNGWPETVRRLADRLGVTRSVRLVESALVEVPAVVGWLRPVLLVPASALTGLAPAHLEAILAHELAHVRRLDYLVNASQCVVEVLLFYHPAVWWLSSQVRVEREHCCDDLAASLCADRLTYARALMSLEELRGTMPRLAMAASGGGLLGRIRRLVEPEAAAGPRWSGGFMMTVVLTVLLVAASGQFKSTPAANESPTQGTVTAPPRDVRPAAQTDRGAIAGQVLDQSGGTLPGVTVTVTSSVTSGTHTTLTDPRGRFRVADLAPGAYDVTMALSSFRKSHSRVQVAPDATATADARLELGGHAEEVTIIRDASAPAPAPPGGPAPANPKTTADYLDAAKWYYEQGRLSESDQMLTTAQTLLRTAMPETPVRAISPVSASGPVRVGGDVREPRRTRNVEPIYPADALAAGVQGDVTIEAILDRVGTVRDARVVTGHPLLDEAALGAVRQWLYTPAKLNGSPIEVAITVTIVFKTR